MLEALVYQAALEEIDEIRRRGFDPGEVTVRVLVLNRGPERALAIMQVSAGFDKHQIETMRRLRL